MSSSARRRTRDLRQRLALHARGHRRARRSASTVGSDVDELHRRRRHGRAGASAPGNFTTIGTCSSGSYSMRPMCPTWPCSPSSSPWSAVTMMSAFS